MSAMTEPKALPPLIIEGPVKEAYLLLLACSQGPAVCADPGVTLWRDMPTVRRAERETGLVLEGPLLLLFSEQSRLSNFNFDLDELATYRKEADEADIPKDVVPVGRHSRPRHSAWICVERGVASPDVLEYREESAQPRRTPLGEWLSSIAQEALLDHQSPGVMHDRPTLSREQVNVIEAWAQKARLEIRWSGANDAPAPEVVRVRHARFGVGVVVREEGSGEGRKLEIDFGQAGTRALLARFVEELP